MAVFVVFNRDFFSGLILIHIILFCGSNDFCEAFRVSAPNGEGNENLQADEKTPSFCGTLDKTCPVNYNRANNADFCFMITADEQRYGDYCFHNNFNASDYKKFLDYLIEAHKDGEFWLSDRKGDSQLDEFLLEKFGDLTEHHKIKHYHNCFKFHKSQVILEDCENKYKTACPSFREALLKLACPEGTYSAVHGEYHDHCYSLDNNFMAVDDWEGLIKGKLEDLQWNTNQNEQLYLKKVPMPPGTTQMFLEYDEQTLQLELTVHHGEFLFRHDEDKNNGIKCFVNFGKRPELKRTTIQKSLHLEVYRVSSKSSFPQFYWCEGHLIKTNQLIATKKVIAFPKDIRSMFSVNATLNLSESYLKMTSTNEPRQKYKDLLEKTALIPKQDFSDLLGGTKSEPYVAMVLIHAEAVIKQPEIPAQVYSMMEELRQYYSKASFVKQFHSIRSLKYCFEEELPAEDRNMGLESVEIGGSTFSSCELSTGLPFTMRCIGDRVTGGTWERVPEGSERCMMRRTNNSSDVEPNWNSTDLKPAAVLKNGAYIQKQARNDHNLTEQSRTKTLIFNLMDSIMHTNQSVLEKVYEVESQATNQILKLYDKYFDMENTGGMIDQSAPEQKSQKKLLEFTLDPETSRLSGVALYRSNSHSETNSPGDSTQYHVEYIPLNRTVDEVLQRTVPGHHLEFGAFVPETLYNDLRKVDIATTDKLLIKITIFFNDKLHHSSNKEVPVDSVLRLSIPGYVKHLPSPLPIFHKRYYERNGNPCVYYNLKSADSSSLPMGWINEGCAEKEHPLMESMIVCECSHLSHFSSLLTGQKYHPNIDEGSSITHHKLLDTITTICISLSVTGIIGIFFTAIKVPLWRENMANRCYINLTIAIAIQLVFFIISDKTSHISRFGVCLFVGATLQYATLLIFVWMCIIAGRVVIVIFDSKIFSNISWSFGRLTTVAWMIPAVPTIVSMAVAPHLYRRDQYDICYPHSYIIYTGIILPICVIVIMNLTFYIMIRWHLSRVSNHIGTTTKQMQKIESVMTRSFVSYLGLTYIFGLISSIEGMSSFITTIFIYLFSIAAPLQGFLLFVDAVLFNPNVRRTLWIIIYHKDKMPSTSTQDSPDYPQFS